MKCLNHQEPIVLEGNREMTIESDLIYPHGKLAVKQLHGLDGYLLALQYKNPASLGKALSALGGEIYWLPPENDRATIWLNPEAVNQLPADFSERLTYLEQFEVEETKRPCDKCQRSDVLYACGKFGHPIRLLCLKCSRFASATSEKALAAREEAEHHRNVLRIFRSIRKVQQPVRTLAKAA